METKELSLLSREELIRLVQSQQEKIQELTTVPPNDWHSLFYALLMIVTHKFKSVKVEREVVLGAQPPRADFVVLEEDGVVDMGLQIFRIFRKTNILEFKSPDDDLNESILWKVVGYAGFYISKFSVSADEVTLTLFRGSRPVKLLKDMQEFIEPDETKGIYHIKGWKVSLPIQIVVTTELEGAEYAGFRAISKNPKAEDVRQILSEVMNEHDDNVRNWYRDYLDLFSKLDNDMIENAKRRYPEMAKTWRDIFKPEIDEWIREDRDITTRNNLFKYVQEGDMPIDRAAKRAGMSVSEFEENMRKAGFNVPQETLV